MKDNPIYNPKCYYFDITNQFTFEKIEIGIFIRSYGVDKLKEYEIKRFIKRIKKDHFMDESKTFQGVSDKDIEERRNFGSLILKFAGLDDR